MCIMYIILNKLLSISHNATISNFKTSTMMLQEETRKYYVTIKTSCSQKPSITFISHEFPPFYQLNIQ